MRFLLLVLCLLSCGCASLDVTVNLPPDAPPRHHKHPKGKP